MNHTEVTEKCLYCPHGVTGTPWWVGQQMSIHIDFAHRDLTPLFSGQVPPGG